MDRALSAKPQVLIGYQRQHFVYKLVNVFVCMHNNLSHNIVGLHASTLLVLDVKLFTISNFHHTLFLIHAVLMACGFVENVSSNRKLQGKSLV